MAVCSVLWKGKDCESFNTRGIKSAHVLEKSGKCDARQVLMALMIKAEAFVLWVPVGELKGGSTRKQDSPEESCVVLCLIEERYSKCQPAHLCQG